MGDSYDEDEGRLMIDDAILESTHLSQNTSVSAEVSKSTSYEKAAEFTPPAEDGVESHPVDPEPKTNFYCESGVSKVVQGSHRDDRLKMTIRRTQSPVNSGGQFTYHGEKHGDGTSRVDDISKEDGEIDDDEETGNSAHTQSIVSTATHQQPNWSGYQSVAFESSSGGTSKFRHSGQQQFEHHPLYNSPHSGTRQPAVNISVSSTVPSPGSPNATGSVTIDEHNSRTLSSSYSSKAQNSPVNTRTGTGANQSSLNNANDEGCANATQQNTLAENDVLENVGSSLILGSKSRKKKLRVNERDERDTCQASSSASSAHSDGVCPVKKKKPNTRDCSTCVNVKSVQTNDSDVDVGIGSTHCLNISILAKASNYLYFVTNWNGHDLYGVLGDGLPPLQHTYMSKKNGGSSASVAVNSVPVDSFSSHDKTNGGSPLKQRPNAKRINRSSSVCPPNGFPDAKSLGRKCLVGAVVRPSSASTSDVQSVGGDLQDEERSQSPVSWFTSGANDPVSALGCFGTDGANASIYLRECSTSAMYSCPVAGCEHRYDMQSQLAVHFHTHFVKEDGGRAIFVETMGTQTDAVIMSNIALDPIKELTDLQALSSDEFVKDAKSPKNDEKATRVVPSKPKLSKTLTNHEEQSISELFKVVTQKADAVGCKSAIKSEEKKSFAVKSPGISSSTSKAYGTLLNASDTKNLKEMPTALDAMRKMVTNSGSETGALREQQLAMAVSSSASVPSTSVTFATSHGGAASPAFSDISDDAPTLEKEVADKSEVRSLDRIKELVNSADKASLGQLSLSIEGEKVSSVSKSGGIGLSNLLCPAGATTTTTVSALSVPRVSADTSQGATTDGSKKNESKTQAQVNTVGPFGSPFIDPSSFAGLRHPSSIPVTIPNLPNTPNASVFAQPYFMPFINPSASNTAVPGLPQPPTNKHKIHDLKANSLSLLPSHCKESGTLVQTSSVVTSPSSRPLSQGGPGSKQAVHQPTLGQGIASGSSFTGVQPHAAVSGDRNAITQNAQSSALNFMQQQQAYFAQLQQQQQMQYMQRFGTGFPMAGPPNSMNAVAQQAYEQQMAALHASFGFPGIFMPSSFPPK